MKQKEDQNGLTLDKKQKELNVPYSPSTGRCIDLLELRKLLD
jgi:hypothetical protein